MPIYEYECTSCGSLFEKLHLGGAIEMPGCPRCSAHHRVRRRISASSFVLKGGGWYRDLYASPKPEAKGGGESGGAKGSGGGTGGGGKTEAA